MFLPVIRAQADEEQKKLWLPLAENYRIIGCYAQTEVRGFNFTLPSSHRLTLKNVIFVARLVTVRI